MNDFSSIINSLSLGKILNGLNKTLNTVNQVIPLYQQIKPIINNSKSLLSIINNINNDSKENKVIEQKKVSNNNLPTFFQ